MLALDAEGTHRPGGSAVLGTWKLRAETRAEVKLGEKRKASGNESLMFCGMHAASGLLSELPGSTWGNSIRNSELCLICVLWITQLPLF